MVGSVLWQSASTPPPAPSASELVEPKTTGLVKNAVAASRSSSRAAASSIPWRAGATRVFQYAQPFRIITFRSHLGCALRLERIAEATGVSRATVWRHGLTRRAVEHLLRDQLAADYQALMWEPLTMPGTGAERFAAALRTLCAVAERNLPLLAHTDTAFHGPDLEAAGLSIDYSPRGRGLRAPAPTTAATGGTPKQPGTP